MGDVSVEFACCYRVFLYSFENLRSSRYCLAVDMYVVVRSVRVVFWVMRHNLTFFLLVVAEACTHVGIVNVFGWWNGRERERAGAFHANKSRKACLHLSSCRHPLQVS